MLKENDIVYLKSGMEVYYSNFQEIFLGYGSKFSRRSGRQRVIVGHVYRNQTDASDVRKRLALVIQQAFQKEDIIVDPEILRRFLAHQAPDPKPRTFVVPEGEYLVTNIFQADEELHIFCTTLEPTSQNPSITVLFFQGRPDTACHDELKATRRLF